MRLEPTRTNRYQPLDLVRLQEVPSGLLRVCDGAGREYLHKKVHRSCRWYIGGAAGLHQVRLEDPQGRLLESLQLRVEARSRLEDQGGEFSELLAGLYAAMVRGGETDGIFYQGQSYRYFVCWIRDHVHVLKGMKYFYPRLTDALELYRLSQRGDGMIWDNVQPRHPEPNYWDIRLEPGGFIQRFADERGEFKRIPVEADVEYLFVEGIYQTWRATGDDPWMASMLDSALRALQYTYHSPLRWSEVHQLVKRGYTIDTWDYQSSFHSPVRGDPMLIDAQETRFGVFHGDNTGYATACESLAQMLQAAGRESEAEPLRQRAAQIRRRLDALAWQGHFFRHHVPEHPENLPDFGIETSQQLSLSNAYALNRGITAAQADAILGSYQKLFGHLPPGSPGEWYTIYPPFPRGFGELWQYMNGGVTSIVAGELARGALVHGWEAYGVDILRRFGALARRLGIFSTYTGSIPPPPKRTFTPWDLSELVNIDLAGQGAPGIPGWTGEGDNDLHEMPQGEQHWWDVPLELLAHGGKAAAIGLRRNAGYVDWVSIPLNRRVESIYLLQTMAGPGSIAGTLRWEYADGTDERLYMRRGEHLTGWWYPEDPGPQARVAWRGANRHSPNVGVILTGLNNPHPERKVQALSFQAAEDGTFWALLALTLSQQRVYFPPSPISGGIPDNWGAAAMVYALMEGLVGVQELDRGFNRVLVAPRWAAAGVDRVRACVCYPASGGYLAYTYRYRSKAKRQELHLTGSGQEAQVAILAPEGLKRCRQVLATDSKGGSLAASFQVVRRRHSVYLAFELPLPGPWQVTLAWE